MTSTKKLTFASICLICCFVLPMLTARAPQVTQALCLMHFPVMVCGMMCGVPWGVAVGVTAPILRSLAFGMPLMFPDAVAMCMELGTYGAVCGFMANDPRKEPAHIFMDLIGAMIAGRIVWGIGMTVLAGFSPAAEFSFAMFRESVISTWPGVMLQLMSLPPLIVFLVTIQEPDEIQTI